MITFRNRFKKVIISGKCGTAKPILAKDIGFDSEHVKTVESDYKPVESDTCLLYNSNKPVNIEGFVCLHVDFISGGESPFIDH